MNKRKIVISFLLLFVGFLSCDNEPYEGELFFSESNNEPIIPDDFEKTFYAE